jgi:hypothetical protein
MSHAIQSGTVRKVSAVLLKMTVLHCRPWRPVYLAEAHASLFKDPGYAARGSRKKRTCFAGVLRSSGATAVAACGVVPGTWCCCASLQHQLVSGVMQGEVM